jgi:hypothetical protein
MILYQFQVSFSTTWDKNIMIYKDLERTTSSPEVPVRQHRTFWKCDNDYELLRSRPEYTLLQDSIKYPVKKDGKIYSITHNTVSVKSVTKQYTKIKIKLCITKTNIVTYICLIK